MQEKASRKAVEALLDFDFGSSSLAAKKDAISQNQFQVHSDTSYIYIYIWIIILSSTKSHAD